MADVEQLQRLLHEIDGQGYKAYKRIGGAWLFRGGALFVDYVQGDPFAAPSKVRLRFDQETAALPGALRVNAVRRTALCDYLARQVDQAIRTEASGDRGSGKSGDISIDAGGQVILDRSAVALTDDWVEARLEVGLPARGRKVLGRQAAALLCEELLRIGRAGLLARSFAAAEAQRHVECGENHDAIQRGLRERGLAAFVADDSILPRASGVSERPMPKNGAVPFATPASLRVTFDLPNPIDGEGTPQQVTGMGIPKGVTLLVGGGYHGKSTLLRAVELGVYPHVPGDGRACVAADRDAVKVRAEDRRRIACTDISPFISNLPGGRDTVGFSTDEASGSTSQAAALMEAVEAGSRVLLMDEDTCATNFMMRDARMQALVARGEEPITPFLDRVRELYDELGISTILVMGGCGDYLEDADTVIHMKEFEPYDVTTRAKEIVAEQPTQRAGETRAPLHDATPRCPDPRGFDASKGDKLKIDAAGPDEVRFGMEQLDLRAVEQVADRSQARAIGSALQVAAQRFMDGRSLAAVLDALEQILDTEGVESLDPRRRGEQHPGRLSRPRRHEVAAAMNRLRTARMRQAAAAPA